MKSIIITGSNSGIGLEAAKKMAEIAPDEQIILACRNPESAQKAVDDIRAKSGHKNIKYMHLDLGSLKSIREFKEQFAADKHNTIISLVNNAGLQNSRETKYTSDGFELTFGTNHLGPFYLTMLLLPYMDKQGSIVFTASGTHNPEEKTGIEKAAYTSARELAYPKNTGESNAKVGQRRYATSKLCNVLTTYTLQEKLAHTGIRVNAFDPGLTPDTGLARTYPAVMVFILKRVIKVMKLFVKNIQDVDVTGGRLAKLAYSPEFKNLKGIYFSDGRVTESSKDSHKKALQDDLWQTSVELTGLKEEDTNISLA